jgi:hypothetical protein
MGSQKALQDFELTLVSTGQGYEAKFNRIVESAGLRASYTTVISGRESFNSDYDTMLHRESTMIIVYNDEVVRQFLVARQESLVDSEEPIVEA